MEKSTPLGLVAGFVLIFGAVLMGDGWATFFDLPSFLLVVGGTAAALMTGFSFADLRKVPGLVKDLFAFEAPDTGAQLAQFADFAKVARRDGLLALDRRISEAEDPLTVFGLEMAVDGIDEAEIDEMLRKRIGEEMRERQIGPKFFNAAGTYAPAFGMVGTLIGLIQMMQNLSDPSQIGSGMAVAMVTTFYGALLANLVCLPMATKMKAQAGILVQHRDMIRLGILSIVRGESPSMIEKRLHIFVVPESPARAEARPATPLYKAA